MHTQTNTNAPIRQEDERWGCQVPPTRQQDECWRCLMHRHQSPVGLQHVCCLTHAHTRVQDVQEGARCAFVTHIGPQFVSWGCWPHSQRVVLGVPAISTPSRSLRFGGAHHPQTGPQDVCRGVSPTCEAAGCALGCLTQAGPQVAL